MAGMTGAGATRRFTSQINNQLDEWLGERMKGRMERMLDVIEAESQRLVPERTGRTRNSWYRRVVIREGEVVAEFGYDESNTISYLQLIYENPRGIVFRKEGAEDRWLARALENKRQEILATLIGG